MDVKCFFKYTEGERFTYHHALQWPNIRSSEI